DLLAVFVARGDPGDELLHLPLQLLHPRLLADERSHHRAHLLADALRRVLQRAMLGERELQLARRLLFLPQRLGEVQPRFAPEVHPEDVAGARGRQHRRDDGQDRHHHHGIDSPAQGGDPSIRTTARRSSSPSIDGRYSPKAWTTSRASGIPCPRSTVATVLARAWLRRRFT